MQQTAETYHQTLERLREEGAHMLLPSIYFSEIPPSHRITIEPVPLEPDPIDGDVYEQGPSNAKGGQRYALTAQGLKKLATAAGITLTAWRNDDGSNPNYFEYGAKGVMKKMDGTTHPYEDFYDEDLEIRELTIRENAEWYVNTYDKNLSEDAKLAKIENKVRKAILQKRQHAKKAAYTGAISRVIRTLLSIQRTYSKDDLKKPFVVVRLSPKVDTSDPEIRRELDRRALDSMYGVYGTPAKRVSGPRPSHLRLAGPKDEPPAEDLDDLETDDKAAYEPIPPEDQDPPPPEMEPDPEPEDDNPDPVTADFLALDQEDRIKTISEAAKQRGIGNSEALWKYYAEQTGKQPPKSVKAMPEKDMTELFKALMALPVGGDAQEEDDDIPF